MKIFVFSWLLTYVILFFLCVYNRIRLRKCALKLGEYIAEYEMNPVFPNDSETYRNAMTDLFRYNSVIKDYVKTPVLSYNSSDESNYNTAIYVINEIQELRFSERYEFFKRINLLFPFVFLFKKIAKIFRFQKKGLNTLLAILVEFFGCLAISAIEIYLPVMIDFIRGVFKYLGK